MASNLAPFAMVPRDLIAQVKPRALQVWCCLCQWSDRDERKTTPSHARIAAEIGASVQVVIRSIDELVSTGRLQRISGKHKGKPNEYRTIVTRLDSRGQPKTVEGSTKNGRPPIKEVNQEALTNPLTPVEVDAENRFAKLCETYPPQKAPRKDKHAQAREVWNRYTRAQQDQAQAAAEVMRLIWNAAPDGRKQMTPQLKKWLEESRYNYHPADVEAHYHVDGLLHEIRQERAARAQHQKFLQEQEEMQAQLKKEREQWQSEQRNKPA